ncbi:MAG: DUF1015 family protein [Fibrobacterota bacterium]
MPDLLVPSPDVELSRWTVNACDQHVHDSSFWDRTRDRIGRSPSSLSLILPEADLCHNDLPDRIHTIHRCMEEYLHRGILNSAGTGFMVVNRETSRQTRRAGLLVAFDLEAWHQPDQQRFALRPTERVVEERLPARLSIRENAAIEIPHALVLVDDPRGILSNALDSLTGYQIYRTILAENAGVVSGTLMQSQDALEAIVVCLESLAAAANPESPVWCIGDGNHSLEAARRHWSHLRTALHPGYSAHPARYLLAELVPLQSPGLEILPVHRGFSGISMDVVMKGFEEVGLKSESCNAHELQINLQSDHPRWIAGWTNSDQAWGLTFADFCTDGFNDVLDEVLFRLLDQFPSSKIDYLHGWEEAASGGLTSSTIYLRSPTPQSLAEAFRSGHVFPPKSFSLGTPSDKRHYLEVRRIRHPTSGEPQSANPT